MRRDAKLVYFLDRVPDEPLVLSPDRPCRIGRGGGCDVFILDVDVSRCHAEISWEKGAFVVTDLGSANGTFVNGAPVLQQVLEPGDEIRVGSRTLGFRAEEASSVEDACRASARRIREVSTAVSYSPLEGGIAGAVADLPLAEVLQVLERARKTGRLHVGCADWHGAVSLREGRVIAAEWMGPDGGATSGLEAAFAILALEDGVFEFVAEAVPEEASIDQPVQALLLESMRRMDEIERSSGSAEAGAPDAVRSAHDGDGPGAAEG